MRALTVNMSSNDGLLIYPEGTRWTTEKLARAKEIIAERQPEIAPLGSIACRTCCRRGSGARSQLLESARSADVVIFGHVGLDGFEYISDIWSGGLVGGTVKPEVLALLRRGGAKRARRADRMAVRALAGAGRLGRGGSR